MINDPKLLVHLAETVNLGSLTKAAEALNISQPAVTKSLQVLESSVDAHLVERGRKGASANEFGERLAVYGRVVNEMLRRANEDVAAWKSGSIGHIRVGVAPSEAPAVLDTVIGFLSRHPRARVSIVETGIIGLQRGIETSSLDLSIGPIGMLSPPSGFIAQHLYDDELSLLCSCNHPLAGRDNLRPSDLAESDWLGHAAGSPMDVLTGSILAASGVVGIRSTIEPDSMFAFSKLLRSGRFLTMLPERCVREEIESGAVAKLKLDLIGARWSVGAIHREGSIAPALLSSFVAHLISSLS